MCTQTVRSALEAIPGVVSASVSLATTLARVEHNESSTCNPSLMKDAIDFRLGKKNLSCPFLKFWHESYFWKINVNKLSKYCDKPVPTNFLKWEVLVAPLRVQWDSILSHNNRPILWVHGATFPSLPMGARQHRTRWRKAMGSNHTVIASCLGMASWLFEVANAMSLSSAAERAGLCLQQLPQPLLTARPIHTHAL